MDTICDVSSLCSNCDLPVSDSDKALKCDICATWEHIECSHIHSSIYAALLAHPSDNLSFTCTRCKSISTSPLRKKQKSKKSKRYAPAPSSDLQDSLVRNVPDVNSVEPSVTLNAPMRSSDCTDEQNTQSPWLSTKRRHRMKTRPPAHDHEVVESLPVSSASAIQPTVSGNRETLKFPRDHCLMLFGSKESGEEGAQARYNHDLNLLQGLVDKLADADEPGIRVRRILRLGKRVAGIHRPLKIVFENADAPKHLLSRAWRLKGMDIYIRPDMDPSQRAQLKAAVVELRRRTLEGENDLRIVNFRIVKWRAFINRPVTLTARSQSHSLACV
ncbi:hypothetical protein T265_03373 [Opisthorchis viverrini]|nr:hypothetical protein T265_03373 [Opisthorchis viverrini]XP_009171761.1 hypothetical protein T265_07857 [Opisthorchis viverrini]KER24491.1 hypothetical protein T265_07857 [Opisthorchis viverrini]KER30107.1 hypothetical protein T265_03373 [Opisthorchis viverrini]